MDVSRDFDELLSSIYTAHINKSGKMPGLLLQVFYSAVAICGWGLYKLANYIGKQILPDTSDQSMLELHAKVRGLSLIPNESSADLLARIIDDIQYPHAGGNTFDWVRWAKGTKYVHYEGTYVEWTEKVKVAKIHENARGPGSINIIITSDRTESGYEENATGYLVDAVTAYIETQRPLGIWDYAVVSADRLLVDVTIDITADDYAATAMVLVDQIRAYLKALAPGQVLSVSMLHAIAINAGATDAVVLSPVANVTPSYGPTFYQRIWPYNVGVGEIS
jgi:uncharacterized phage protein gp47/JayE